MCCSNDSRVCFVLEMKCQIEAVLCGETHGIHADVMTVPTSVPSISLQVRSLLPDAIYYSLARVLTLPAPGISLPSSLDLSSPQPPSSHLSSESPSSARTMDDGSPMGGSSDDDVVVTRVPHQPQLAIVTAGTSDLAVAEVRCQRGSRT